MHFKFFYQNMFYVICSTIFVLFKYPQHEFPAQGLQPQLIYDSVPDNRNHSNYILQVSCSLRDFVLNPSTQNSGNIRFIIYNAPTTIDDDVKFKFQFCFDFRTIWFSTNVNFNLSLTKQRLGGRLEIWASLGQSKLYDGFPKNHMVKKPLLLENTSPFFSLIEVITKYTEMVNQAAVGRC